VVFFVVSTKMLIQCIKSFRRSLAQNREMEEKGIDYAWLSQ
jgi:hypothetical protein